MRLQQTETPVRQGPKISRHAWTKFETIIHGTRTIRDGAVFNAQSAVPPYEICVFGLLKRPGGRFDVAGPSSQTAAADRDGMGLRSTERQA